MIKDVDSNNLLEKDKKQNIEEEGKIENIDNLPKIYKINDIIDYNHLNLETPIKKDNSFFCKLKNEFILQIDNIECINYFYDYKDKTFINLSINNSLNKIILDIDNRLVNIIYNNFKKWFNKSVKIQNILDYFVQTKMHNQHLEPYIVLNVPKYENEIDINIYDSNNQILDNTNLPKFKKCISLIKLNGIYLEKYRFYCCWELIQLKIIN